jgi:hypothetical protein
MPEKWTQGVQQGQKRTVSTKNSFRVVVREPTQGGWCASSCPAGRMSAGRPSLVGSGTRDSAASAQAGAEPVVALIAAWA